VIDDSGPINVDYMVDDVVAAFPSRRQLRSRVATELPGGDGGGNASVDIETDR